MDVSFGGVSCDSGKLVRGGGAPQPSPEVYGGFMDTGFCEVGAERARDVSMAASLEVMHPLDPPPPDVLLALLARNKALEGNYDVTVPCV
ncbi:unnamed protein product [Pieris macdunnoughi]|uniref:Uncharacterized protein n=1 Tax=Pieris macdunnoughi TaxID=345717 RepID=A0A821LZR2_9NEOP|nr:unnamed protein product [Pieris macdunnoughi]